MTGQRGATEDNTEVQSEAEALIDNKYEVIRELSRKDGITLSEVRAGGGAVRRLAWFEIATPEARQAFYNYRKALKATQPKGLTDVVARPGAYYAVWQNVAGTPLSDWQNQKVKPAETLAEAEALATHLAEYGYAFSDADVVVDGNRLQVAYLHPVPPRTPEEVARRNATAFASLRSGKVRQPRQSGMWLSVVPGVAFLIGAGYLGYQALQIYLNPPVREVASIAGQDAKAAAKTLSQQGFRVEYSLNDSTKVPIGAVISQDPPAGTNLPVGRKVTLLVNNPPSVPVPKLEELTPQQAVAILRDNSLVVGKIAYKVDGALSNTPAGRIIAQYPEAGSSLQRGQPVQVLVSNGKRGKDTWIAILKGMSVEDAKKHAKAAGLIVNKIVEEPSDAPEGTVLAQKPAPFVKVAVGSPVTLTVATTKYSAPAKATGDLPVPPPYVPPAPPPAADGTVLPTDPVAPPTTPQQPTAPETPQDVPSPQEETPTQPATPDATAQPTPAPADGPQSRTVHFRYAFPSDLPPGQYSVIVRDADGEREIRAATSAAELAGMTAEGDFPVRGDAVFVIRKDGALYTTVTP